MREIKTIDVGNMTLHQAEKCIEHTKSMYLSGYYIAPTINSKTYINCSYCASVNFFEGDNLNCRQCAAPLDLKKMYVS